MDKKKPFQSDLGHPIFCCPMSYNHFTFISATLTFDDPTTQSARFETAAYREVFELINDNFAHWIFADPYVAIEKLLYLTRDEIASMEKLAKYGLNF